MSTVPLKSLPPGSAFKAPWKPIGYQFGEVIRHGTGSSFVKVVEVNDNGASWKSVPWSLNTQVEPATREELNTQAVGNTDRNRSEADSPVELVHKLCDEMKGRPRDEIVAAAIAKGVNINTAKTQYYVWRKKQR